MTKVGLIAARRTAVCPRHGAFKTVGAADLGAVVIRALMQDAPSLHVDQVIMGNALYGGGNPARVAALAAGLPVSTPALTIDTQCCSGLDAIGLARAKIIAGEADSIIAGGLESYSQSPIRLKRDTQEAYERPPFTPWPNRDPDLLVSVADLARRVLITRDQQEEYAINSHAKSNVYQGEIAELAGVIMDTFTRPLTSKLCERLPIVQGDATTGLTDATIAVQADAAAGVVVVSEVVAKHLGLPLLEIQAYRASAGHPEKPALAPIELCRPLVERYKITHIELMEAFAAQAIVTIQSLGLHPQHVNPAGGALARGHPIGASGTILAVRLFHHWKNNAVKFQSGLATIAAAGGLASALVVG
jgi:acetyl-CoA C-acetyltransferase